MKLLPVLCIALLTAHVRADDIKAGFADREVTPDIGMEVPGGYGKSFGKQIHDSPKVRAAVFDDGKHRVAIVGLDSLIVRRETALEARRRIAERTGIPADCVLPGASHSARVGAASRKNWAAESNTSAWPDAVLRHGAKTKPPP